MLHRPSSGIITVVGLFGLALCLASAQTAAPDTALSPGGNVTGAPRRRQLEEQELLRAMHASLGQPAEITILDFSRQPVPDGVVSFALSDIKAGSAGDSDSVYWRGKMARAAEWPVPIWVRATIRARVRRLVAVEMIPRGTSVTAQHLSEEERVSVPLAGYADSAAELLGSIPRRNIRPGELLHRSDFTSPFDVRRGEVITVVVKSGGARLTLAARAEADGHVRDSMPFRNITGHSRFRAVLEAPGVALLEMPKK